MCLDVRVTGRSDCATGKYDEAGLEALDYVIASASKHGVKLILSFIDNWKYYNGVDQFVDWVSVVVVAVRRGCFYAASLSLWWWTWLRSALWQHCDAYAQSCIAVTNNNTVSPDMFLIIMSLQPTCCCCCSCCVCTQCIPERKMPPPKESGGDTDTDVSSCPRSRPQPQIN